MSDQAPEPGEYGYEEPALHRVDQPKGGHMPDIDEAIDAIEDVYEWIVNEVEAGDTALRVHRDRLRDAMDALREDDDV